MDPDTAGLTGKERMKFEKLSIKTGFPFVSVIIVHYKGEPYLSSCIHSVKNSTYLNLELIVVDNGADPLPWVHDEEVIFIKNKKNLGFAEGCNVGIRSAKGEYVFILNNDVEIEKECIEKLILMAKTVPAAGVYQPKMLDFHERNKFHSSAAGGMMDILGYPFARGRIFETAEEDKGQYDQKKEVFWASGAAFFAKKEILEKAGLFDKDFFLYMEEIDLCWRVQLIGYKIVYIPEAKIYHRGDSNLGRENWLRMYYVHRNSMAMMIKNYSSKTLLWVLPLRILVEIGTLFLSSLLFKGKRVIAILKSFKYLLSNIGILLSKRKAIQERRRMNDQAIFQKLYKGSIGFQYIVFQKKIFSRLNLNIE